MTPRSSRSDQIWLRYQQIFRFYWSAHISLISQLICMILGLFERYWKCAADTHARIRGIIRDHLLCRTFDHLVPNSSVDRSCHIRGVFQCLLCCRGYERAYPRHIFATFQTTPRSSRSDQIWLRYQQIFLFYWSAHISLISQLIWMILGSFER